MPLQWPCDLAQVLSCWRREKGGETGEQTQTKKARKVRGRPEEGIADFLDQLIPSSHVGHRMSGHVKEQEILFLGAQDPLRLFERERVRMDQAENECDGEGNLVNQALLNPFPDLLELVSHLQEIPGLS